MDCATQPKSEQSAYGRRRRPRPEDCSGDAGAAVRGLAQGVQPPPAGFAPVPLSATGPGPPDALLAIVTVALRAPRRVGMKVTDAVHEAPGFNEAPLQPFGQMEKSPGFVPPRVSDEMTSGALPVLVIFTCLTELASPSSTDPNPIDVGVRVNAGAATNPVPVRTTSGGTPCELPGTSSFPVCEPAAVGANRTETVQDVFGASGAVQVFVCVKGPVVVMTPSVSGAVPMFWTARSWAGLAVPMACDPKFAISGVARMIGSGRPGRTCLRARFIEMCEAPQSASMRVPYSTNGDA